MCVRISTLVCGENDAKIVGTSLSFHMIKCTRMMDDEEAKMRKVNWMADRIVGKRTLLPFFLSLFFSPTRILTRMAVVVGLGRRLASGGSVAWYYFRRILITLIFHCLISKQEV